MTIFKTYRLKGVRAPLHRKIKWFWQRITRGFDDTELWNFDSTIVSFILPRLIEFRHSTYGFPANFQSIDEWYDILDRIIKGLDLYNNVDAFDYASDEHGGLNQEKYDEWEATVSEAFFLLGKWLNHFWY